MTIWQYTRSALLANIALVTTFLFLPILLITDNISVYQEFLNYLLKK